MNDFVTDYNKCTTNTPIRPADVKRISGEVTSKTGIVATAINSFLSLRTGDESIGMTGAWFGHQNYHKYIKFLAVPKISEAGGDETLRITALVYDKAVPEEPKSFELITYDLNIAHMKNVIAGIMLSLVEGPLGELNYTKLKIDITRDILDALQHALTPATIAK